MPIYDDRERIDLTPQRNGETSFAFFNRAGGSVWREIRALHQEWADELDPRAYVEVRAAIRSEEAQARSAFLELYLHACLVRGGHRVVVHPEAPRSSRRPDFLAIKGSGRFFVEAIAPGVSPAERAAANRIGVLLAALDQVGDDNFFLMTTSITQANNSAPSGSFRDQIRKWLSRLDPDSVNPRDLPSQTFERSGWSVTVEAVPIERGSRGSVSRSIGIYAHNEAQFIDDRSTLVAALDSKASRYGPLEQPFVLAVGTTSFDDDDEDVFSALYGSVSWLIGGLGPGEELTSRGVRNLDGFFGAPGNWKNRRVSAVLIVDQLQLHDPTRARVALWIHPDPLHPLPSEPIFPGVIHEWNGKTTDKRAGLDPRTLLRLADDWPRGHRWTAD